MAKPSHLSDSDLIRFIEKEMANAEAAHAGAHLQTCTQCLRRLDELQNSLTAYDDYHARVLRPHLDASIAEWPSLHSVLANAAKPEKRFVFSLRLLWAQAAIATCLILLGLYFYRDSPHREMRRLLARSAAVPEASHNRLQLTVGGRSWYRPAVLRMGTQQSLAEDRETGLTHVEVLFVKANYNWNDPLSARSFAAWRNRLHEKRDRVTAIRSGDGIKRFYRLQTQTSQGILRTASLTLRADTFRPVNGDFQFADQENVTIADAGEMPPPMSAPVAKQNLPATAQKRSETKASPEDELRVFAALNAIGADAGEPIRVDMDPLKRHVVVTGMGIAPGREQQIRQALDRLPNTTVNFDSALPPTEKNDNNSNGDAAGISEPFRRALEQQAGGPQQLESITEHALDASNVLLQHAHALAVLSQHFPVTVEAHLTEKSQEILRDLRHRHATAVEQANSQLGEALKPLLPSRNNQEHSPETQDAPRASWQLGALQLLDFTRMLNQSVSRVLAVDDSPVMGHDTLNKLPNEMERVTALAHTQATAK